MVENDIEIRNATSADGERIAGLLRAQLHEHAIDTPADAIRSAVEGMLADERRGFILVATRASIVVGVAYVAFTWTLEHGGQSSWLEELYVMPAARNHGIGATLVAAVLDRATAAGCAAVDLEVDTTHTRAAHLYARAGFTAHARARWVKTLRRSD